MAARAIGWPIENVPRGGSDAWDRPTILRDEFFQNPDLSGFVAATSAVTGALTAPASHALAGAVTAAATVTGALTAGPVLNNAVKFNDWVDPFCIGDDFYTQGLTPTPAYPLTFVVWAKLHTTPSGGNYGGIFSVEDGGGHSTEFNEIILDANSNTLVVFDHSGGGTLIGTVGTMTVGTWHKVALRLESGTFAAFIGTQGTPGVSKITGSLTNVTAPGFSGLGSTMFRVTEWFPGVLSRARLWKAALSDAEIAAEFTTAADAAPSGAIVTSNLFGSWLPPTLTLSPSTENVAVVGTNLDQIRGGGTLLRTLDTGPTLDPAPAALAGSVTCSATVTGDLSTGSTAAALAGAVSAGATVTGSLTTAITLAGSVAATATVAGALSTGIPLSSAVSATGTATGALTTAIQLAGAVSASATVTGGLAGGAAALAGAVAASATVTGALTTGIPLAGAVSSSATVVAGALSTSIRLAGGVSASAAVTGALSTAIQLAGAVSAPAVASGALSTAIQLAGSVAASATVTGGLGAQGAALAGGIVASASVAGSLSTSITLAGAVQASATATGTLSTSVRLAGAVVASATLTGALTTAVQLAGAVTASSSATGALSTQKQFAGNVSASSTVTGSLATGITLSGSVSASATVTGALYTPSAVAPTPYVLVVAAERRALFPSAESRTLAPSPESRTEYAR